MTSKASEELFPYPSFRPGQKEIAESIAKVINSGGAFLLNAPTGYGKTAAIIYGVILAGAPKTLYLVRTRNEIAPVTRELMKFNRSFTFLFSARKMCPYASRFKGLSNDDFWENCRLMRLKGVCSYYDNLNSTEAVKDKVIEILKRYGMDPFKVVEQLASEIICPFFALKSLINSSEFIVATYPYYFRSDIFHSIFEQYSREDFVIVVDEAHSILEAHGMFEVKLSQKDITEALHEVEKYAPEAREVVTSLEKLLALVKHYAHQASDRLKRVELYKARSIFEDPEIVYDVVYEVRLRKAKEALSYGRVGEVACIRLALSKIARFLQEIYSEDVSLYIKRENGNIVLTVLPITLSNRIGEALNKSKAVILSSATLPPTKDVKNILGLTKSLTSFSFELFYGQLYSNQYRVILTLELTSKYTSRGEAMYKKYAAYILEAFKAVNDAMLVVYPSYEFMRNTVKLLSELESQELIVEDKSTNISDVVSKVRRNKHILINCVAGGKLAEGIEIREDGKSLIKVIFIAGVPYHQPDDFLDDIIRTYTSMSGQDYMSYLNTVAAIRTRQALGRAIRSLSDRALYILGDRRFLARDLRDKIRIRIDKVVVSLEDYTKSVRRALRELEMC